MYFGEGFPTILSINLVVEIFCIGHNKIIFETMPIKMLSDVGKTYDRSRTIRPMDKNQRERVYASC